MTQYLGFARSYGGDFFVMAWITGNDAKQFDAWNNDDNHPKANITLINVPAVVTKGMSPYTASEGRWIYVTLQLNRTISFNRWSDVQGTMVRGKASIVRTIKVTVRNDDSYIPLFFGRNGNLWLSDPMSNSNTPREDTMLLNMIKVADEKGFPYTVQTKLTSYFPPLERRDAAAANVQAVLPFKSKEAEDIQIKMPPTVKKTPNLRRPKQITPWPQRQEANPHPLGKYSITIPITVEDVITRPHPLSLSRFSTGEPRVQVVSHVRPDPFPTENQDETEGMIIDKPEDKSFDNYQATIPDPKDCEMAEEDDDLSQKRVSFTSSSKSLTSPTVSDTFTPSPDDARALPSFPKLTRAQSTPSNFNSPTKIPPSFPINLTLLQVIPEAQSTPNDTLEEEKADNSKDSSTSKHSSASTIPLDTSLASTAPLPPMSPSRRYTPFRKPVADRLDDDHVNIVTPFLLDLQPSLGAILRPRPNPPPSPGLHQRATLPLPGVLGPDLTPSTSQDYSHDPSTSKEASEPSPSSTRNNPPSKIRFVPGNPDLLTSKIICPDSPTHTEDSPTYAEEYIIEDYHPGMIDHQEEEQADPQGGEEEPQRGEKEKRPHK